MKKSKLMKQFLTFSGLGLISLCTYANEVDVSNNSVNYILWFAVLLGVVAGFFAYQYLHKNFKSHEQLKSWLIAVVVALVIASLPMWFMQFSSICMQQITDSSGQVREMVTGADQCVLSREGISAWGIGAVISGFKGALGYTDAGAFLPTALVKFFYYLLVFIWTTILHFGVLFVWKKIKH